VIEVGEAVDRVLAQIRPLPEEVVATAAAMNRVASQEVVAGLTSPPWRNASMDGYAVRSADIAPGVQLKVVESIAAGSFPSLPIAVGEAARVMTGAPVPEGADTVVRHEDTDNGRAIVTIANTRDARRNIRQAGEDYGAGDVLVSPGALLGVAHLALLASAGVKQVAVHKRPRVAVLSSGDELVALEDFTDELRDKKIVSSNSVSLVAAIREAGGDPVDLGIAGDDRASLREKLELARDADLIVSSAGISVGDHDHIREVFSELGGRIDFWKVRMRPGAPIAFGTLGKTPWIGLSGNPVSAIVTFELFVRPAIRRLLGASDLFRATIPVTLGESITLAAPLMHFLRAVITTENGTHVARLSGSQSSAVLTALAKADALLILPGDNLEVGAGEKHRALPLRDAFLSSDKLQLT
jgi:molybdopterin molybdotransferase